MMAFSIGELMHEAGKMLPKGNSLHEEEGDYKRPVILASMNQRHAVVQSSAVSPAVCNLNDYIRPTSQQSMSREPLQTQPLITGTVVLPQIRRPSQSNQQQQGQSKPLYNSSAAKRLSGYELLQSKTQFSTQKHSNPSPVRPTFPHRRRKSRGLGIVSKQTLKHIRETNKTLSQKQSQDERDIPHPVTEAVQSLTKLEQGEQNDLEITLKQRENTKEVPHTEEEEEEEDYSDEIDDVVAPLASEVCPSNPVEVEKMKKTIHRRSSLYLDVEFVNFGAEMNKKTKTIVNKFRGGVVHALEHITDDVKEDYEMFLNELDDVVFYAYRQAERILQDYSPRTLVLISSAVPKAEMLLSAVKPGVIGLIYDVATETYTSLLEKIKTILTEYKMGAKAKNIAFVCKGGPGYMYLIKSNPITPVRLLKDEQLLKFWKTLGSYMSKLTLRDPSVIHIMESNVAGTPQGTELLSNLEAAMYCHKVKVESPLELEPKGREMISIYFQPEKFSTWKSRRYSKFRLYKI